ncbi:Zn-ribbon domain-containing OB-fold protein [Microbacterium sp. B19]|uniref:Zn-ribbon domain-containing OB-fold protein n=1 Tax=Microbacterium sp. B19 TaxID=96765 RepID=UPI0003B4CE37|nr:OB-fold domain-containing protein [Microbacterium sp. B19]
MIDIVTVDTPHPYPPRISAFTRPFWDALAEGRLLTTRSVTTGALTFPPKPISPADWTTDVEWVELSGSGVLYSHTTIHAAPTAFVGDLPYRVAIVDLDEGLRVATRHIGEIAPVIGAPVDLVAVRHTDAVSFAARSRA